MVPRCFILFWLFVASYAGLAAAARAGSIAGVLVDEQTGHAVGFAAVDLRRPPQNEVVRYTATDAHGAFRFDDVPFGDYRVDFGSVVSKSASPTTASVTAHHPQVDLGRLALPVADVTRLEKMAVSARREASYNSIDRKVYDVGQDLQGAAGSAGSLLQNVPSVQVDVDGNVSLRGNSNVTILIDGKPSPLMSTANRADTLEQMPADSIERIEVITNPSARYRSEGTAGIINLVRKHTSAPGFSGTMHAYVGNARRANTGLTANYHSGRINVFGTFSVRQDDRLRTSQDTRRHTDAATGAPIATTQNSTELMRPVNQLAELGADANLTAADKLHVSVSYAHRSFYRTSTVTNLARTVGGPVTLDYDRHRTDPEWHKTWEVDTRYQHAFAAPGHELAIELQHTWHQELEDNRYENDYRTPATPAEFDTTRMHPTETTTNLTADYTRPLSHDGKLEAGLSAQTDDDDTDFHATVLDPATGLYENDPTRTNRFIYRDWIDAAYATYGRTFGSFGFQAGLRGERTLVHTDEVTLQQTSRTEYYRLHPTLHLSYNLTAASQLLLNYSHRVHRPEGEDLDPFPEYQDPYNLRAGNPQLRPEETHSLEAGYQYHADDTTYLIGGYFRDTYHAFTTVTRYIDAVTLLTTQENLATNRSGGLELAAARSVGSRLKINFSADGYYNEVDASNLGFAGHRSTVTWDAKLNADWHAAKADTIQLNTNFTARRLTAQGYRLPMYYANLGWRHDFAHRKFAFVLTVSDLFDTLKERTIVDTPTLHDDYTRRRSSRIVYAGFTYTFGQPAKKAKSLEYDTSM